MSVKQISVFLENKPGTLDAFWQRQILISVPWLCQRQEILVLQESSWMMW